MLEQMDRDNVNCAIRCAHKPLTIVGNPWWLRLLNRLDIDVDVVELAPNKRKQQVLEVLANEQAKLEAKLERLRDQVHNQLVAWAINDKQAAASSEGYFAGNVVSKAGSEGLRLVSSNDGSTGQRSISAGSSIVRKQRGQR